MPSALNSRVFFDPNRSVIAPDVTENKVGTIAPALTLSPIIKGEAPKDSAHNGISMDTMGWILKLKKPIEKIGNMRSHSLRFGLLS
jgi:hypothetical protein